MPPLMTRPSRGAHASTVQRPSGRGVGQDQRVVLGLTDVEQVLRVDEDAEPAESPLSERANQQVWAACLTIWILVERPACR